MDAELQPVWNMLLGAVHKLRHAEGGEGGGGGVSASVTMYTLSIHQYGIMCDEGGGSIMVKNSVT